MNITQIEEIVKKLVSDVNAGSVNKDEFIYQLMAAYGHRKTTIGRIKSGERNLADVAGEVRAKRHVYFKHCQGNKVLSDIDSMKKQPSVTREKIRFVIVTDFIQFVALDTRTNDTLDIEFNDLGKHFDFFLPWAGMEKAVYQGENPADVKAAEKMARLFDLIKADNFNDENKHNKQALHNLNVFLTRLLFCFFAEDTGIFKQNQFSGELESHTKVDGSDVADYLNRLFEVLNTSKDKRSDLPDYLANFEFVNGGLFADNIQSPRFSTKSRKMLIESGSELDWSDINPDIFGSMIQAVVHPDQRGGMGMHYTSVTNIMKVIEPLFLDELYAELENIEDHIDPKLKPSRLRKLHDRIAEIKVFDPACGSGNFLIIAFKELRKLEMEIIRRLQELDKNENQDDLFGDIGLDSSFSRIKLSQFYGIELDDFAHEVAILSLWLAEHQMNVEFKAEFGECEPSLPLRQGGNIICDNAVTCSWDKHCNASEGETFLIGNPPYLGAKVQSKKQKGEVVELLSSDKKCKTYDYIFCWFYKAGNFIKRKKAKFAFVSTNSISQGEQVSFWNNVYLMGLEIGFAHTSFLWKNNAKSNAAVMCVIVGIRNKSKEPKFLFDGHSKLRVNQINSYLIDALEPSLERRTAPISKIPQMLFGSIAYDGGHLFLDEKQREELVANYPEINEFIRPAIGAIEMLRGLKRWCIWVEDKDYERSQLFAPLVERFKKVTEFRLASTTKSTNDFADRPYRFKQNTYKSGSKNIIIIPRVSSERREYIPIGIFSGDTITVDAQVIYDASLVLFGFLSSKIHVAWVKLTSGRMKSDIRYSSAVSYNNFPIPCVSEKQKEAIELASLKVLEVREQFPDLTLSNLYDPVKMPKELRSAHDNLDAAVENIYVSRALIDDQDRLQVLFSLYANMTGGQNA
tara:strand:- start:13525 stop:16260 length:2736 start_codon:yes stop_codon:yes gene_type:complete